MRVVIDTNVLISFAIRPNPGFEKLFDYIARNGGRATYAALSYPAFRPTKARTAASTVPKSFGITANRSSRSNKSAIRGGSPGR